MVAGGGKTRERHAKQRVCYSERDKIWSGLERAPDYNNQDIFSQGTRQGRGNPSFVFDAGKDNQDTKLPSAPKSYLAC